MIDYTILYKDRLPTRERWGSYHWDVFVSAYNESERVRAAFDNAQAEAKHWLILPEYNYAPSEYPAGGAVFAPDAGHEAEFIRAYSEQSGALGPGVSLCVDITGFMRPHLLFLVRYLRELGMGRFDAVYSDPGRYVEEEETEFSRGPVREVRQVAGYEGNHSPDAPRDLLVIGTGYDEELIRQVAYHKWQARKLPLYGLPSLQPDMYQENYLRVARTKEALGSGADRAVFAPANDPFVTAQVLHTVVAQERGIRGVSNLYLSPLGTKAQVLGFALYYVTECIQTPTSVIFPFSAGYSRETTHGIARVWKYSVDFGIGDAQ